MSEQHRFDCDEGYPCDRIQLADARAAEAQAVLAAHMFQRSSRDLIRKLRETIKPPATPYPDADPGRMPFLYEFQRGWAAANEQVAWIIDKYDPETP